MKMEVRTYEASDGRMIHYREWRPEDCRAVAVNVHGIQSHSGWFLDSCEHLARHGIRVLSLDRRGSGLNEEERGHARSYGILIDDVARVLEGLRSASPDAKIHLLGVCWGGKIAACLAALRPELVDSLVLSAPGLAAKVEPGFGERARIALCTLILPKRRFKIPIDRAEMFTSNPARIEFIRQDPLRLDLATARLMAESRRLDWRLEKVVPRIRVPSLLLLADHDPIVDNEGTARVFQCFGSKDKRIKTFRDACHMLEFEVENTRYFDTLVTWIKEHS